jgi:hypothetical protein
MSHLEDMSSPGSDDLDAMVAQRLSHLESSTSGPATTANEPGSQQPMEEIRPIQGPGSMNFPSIEIRVPLVDNPSDYEYLPGHFKVQRIMRIDSSNPEKPLYTVRLASGERSTVRAPLLTLNTGDIYF